MLSCLAASSLPRFSCVAKRLNLTNGLSPLRRFGCVSKSCLSVVGQPDHREKLSQQPLAGFFYNSTSENRFPESALHFVNASGEGRPLIHPSFAFLPSRRRLRLWDCCNGLLLCRSYDASTRGGRYVVCNPATEQWVVLPDHSQTCKVGTARLGFDPAVSSHFHVFVSLVDAKGRHITGVDVYSSETGRWIHKDKGWGKNVRLADPRCWRCPYIAAVDTKGESWSSFDTPCGLFSGYSNLGLIQQSQGRLHYVSLNNEYDDDGWIRLEVYALKGYTNKEWILKHRGEDEEFGAVTQSYFEWTAAIDPECNSIFFIDGSDKTLKRYDMDHQQISELITLGEAQTPYLPYVPLYSELESLC